MAKCTGRSLYNGLILQSFIAKGCIMALVGRINSHLVREEDPGGQVLDPDPGLDHDLLVGDGGVPGRRQLRVALALPLRPEHRQQQRGQQPSHAEVIVA